MSYGNIKQRTSEAAQPPVDERKCRANGCPCLGSLSFDGGKFTCAAHAFCKSEDWPRVTEKLNEHNWLIAFIDDFRGIEAAGNSKMPGWREYATQFWTGIDEFCIPHPKENILPYENRMRGELLYRCGITKRPAPRLPQPIKGRGNAAALLRKEVA